MAASPEPGASFHLRRLASEPGPWLLALVGGALFWPVLFGGRTLYFRDLELLFFSQRRLFARLVLDGELPLWNTLLHGGTPYLGDISTASLYPTALLYLVLPDLLAFNLEIVAHFVLAGLGAYALARALGLRQAAALVAGLVFGFCGYSLSLANLFVRLLALPWMAWILLAWHLFLTTGRPRWFAATLACGTLQIFAGAPEAVALTQATLALWTVAAGPFTMAFRRRVGWLLAAGLLTLGLAAIQLVPLFEVLAESPRGGSGVGGEHFSDWSLPPERVPELVAPGYLGPLDTFDEADYWGAGVVDAGFPYILSLYLGVPALALALCAGLRSPSPLGARNRAVLWALFLGSLLLSFGRHLPGFEAAYELVPALRIVRFPIKLANAGILPVALLAAAGTHRCLGAGSHRRAIVLLVGTTLALGGVSILFVLGTPGVSARLASTFPGSDPQAAAAGISASLRHAAAVAAALALVLAARGLQHRRWQVGALVAVVGIDLLLAGRPVNQTAPAALLVEPPAALGPVLEHLGTGRLYSAPSPREIQLLAPPTNELWWRAHWRREILDGYRTARYGVPVVLHGDHSLAPARSVALAGALPHLPWQERIPLLSAAGATVLVSADDPAPELEAVAEIPNQSDRIYRIYRNDKAIDGATFVATWLAAGSGGEAMAAMRGAGFDPRRHTVVEGVAASSGDPCTEPAAIDWRRRDPRRWSLDVDTSCPGYLVFSEPFYPDWKVEVDGTEAPLRRANFAFSAVALEPGRHRVERIYRPSRVLAGALITLLTLAAVAAWLARPLRYAPAAPEKRKRPPKRAPSNRR